MPWRDLNVERCVMCAEIRAEIAAKNLLGFRETMAHGCCHIGFPKSCYDGKHADVRDVNR